MFGFLKKKLKDGIDKISKKVKQKEEEKPIEEIKEEQPKEEPKEELEEQKQEVPKEDEEISEEEKAEEQPEEEQVPEDSKEEIETKKAPVEEEQISKEPEKKQDFKEEVEEELEELKEIMEESEPEIEKEVIEELEEEIEGKTKDVQEPEFEEPKVETVIEKEEEIIEPETVEEPVIEKETVDSIKEEPITEEISEPKVVEEIIEKIEESPELQEIEDELEEIKEDLKKLKPELKEVEEEISKEIKITEPEIKEEVKKEEPKVEKKKKEEKPKKKLGFFQKIRKKVTEKELEENDVKDILDDLKTGLIESDVALDVAEKIIVDLRSNLVGKSIKKKEIENVVKSSIRNSILEILDIEKIDLDEKIKSKKPYVMIFVGFNGVGKTTSIARVGYKLKKKGYSCVFAAADSWRAAAIEQLEEHGRNLDIPVIKHKYGADPAAVIFDAIKHAQSKGIDVVLADTAGRSHADTNLVDELKKIIRVNKPDLKILVLDALTGNDIFDQCKIFNDAVGIDAMILTKTDVYEKGGAALSASHTVNKPILFLGLGQEYEDLEEFDAEKIVENLLE